MKNAALRGVRVIDFSHSWAVPHCARVLADYGAEVVKVEYVRRLCLLRGARNEREVYDSHPGWLQVNRNKLSVTLDLNVEADREAFRRLLSASDVLIENSRAGVMDRLGFGYSDIVKIRKDMIMLSSTAFGSSGPFAAYCGYGAVIEAVGGIQSLTAYETDGKPMRIREIDVTTGLAAACAVMTALIHRQRTGEGQHIDLSQLEAASHVLIGEQLLEYFANGRQSLPMGNRHSTFAPQGCYRCSGDDKWVALTVRDNEEWSALCEVVGRPELASDRRFSTSEARMENQDLLDRVIGEWTLVRSHVQVMHALQSRGIPSGAVLDFAEVSSDPHLKERGYFQSGVGGSERPFMGMPFKLSRGEGSVRTRGPRLGEHNDYVFSGLLGMKEEGIGSFTAGDIGMAFDLE